VLFPLIILSRNADEKIEHTTKELNRTEQFKRNGAQNQQDWVKKGYQNKKI
jgi:hypothetical protein